MTDEPFYSSSRQPDPPRAPAPGEPVWKLERHGSWVSCELRDDEDAGCEAQLFRDRAFYAGRRFGTRAAALAHADTVRSRLEHEGWTLATPDRP